MLVYFFHYIETNFHLPGAGLFEYISFRAGAAAVLSLVITITFGKSLINFLRRKQVGEEIRNLGLEGQAQKKGTPTMGGIIIIAAILIPTLLFAQIDNVYVVLLIATTVWLGLIGFIDDYIKVFKKNKEGLAGKFKIVGQVGIGLIVGLTLYFNQSVVVREVNPGAVTVVSQETNYTDVKSTTTTVPFFKNNELDYSKLIPVIPTWLIYTVVCVLIVTFISNGANITD